MLSASGRASRVRDVREFCIVGMVFPALLVEKRGRLVVCDLARILDQEKNGLRGLRSSLPALARLMNVNRAALPIWFPLHYRIVECPEHVFRAPKAQMPGYRS